MLKEFRDFLMRGNVLDLAVAVVLGTAFSAIVSSLVNDIIMPLIGILIGGISFSKLHVQIGSADVTFGNFIQASVDFILIALSIFIFIKIIKAVENQFQRDQEEQKVAPAPPEDIRLLREIRDLLQKQV
jgi:large conductance mechanosensitive channel